MPLGSKMAPPQGSLAPIDFEWEKHKKSLLRNHKAQSFHILSVAMYSGPLYKSCQPCPWDPYGPRLGGGGGVMEKLLRNHKTQSFHILSVAMGKTLKNLLRNHKTQSFHILRVAMYSGPLYKSCQLCPWGPYGGWGGGSWENFIKFSFPKPQGPELSYFVCSNV